MACFQKQFNRVMDTRYDWRNRVGSRSAQTTE